MTLNREAPTSGAAPGVDFARIEREHVASRIYPAFDWVPYDTFSPYNPMTVPLEHARVALVTTAGAHLHDQRPFATSAKEGDPSFRVLPADVDLTEIQLTHSGYDTQTAIQDVQVVLPLDHLRVLVRSGRIGGMTPSIYSTMGYVADTGPFIRETSLEITRLVSAERPDLVLLVPA
ncbi:MAG: glycine/sarcosine/betaine reductase selenoprotein B family protein, partial [Thermomicrobiales bacterium]